MITVKNSPEQEGRTVTVTDAQVRKLMDEMTKHGRVGVAAMRADMDRKTARKYVATGQLPSGQKQPRDWRTRQDPFEADWLWVQEQLEKAPELEAKTLFEALQDRHPERYQDGQVRTLQRRVRRWRAEHGPEKEVFFPQQHRPGEAMQLDFTHATRLGVTIAGVKFVHLLCHVVLPYSNWQHVTVCLSESLLALKRGLQAALFCLGHIPEWLQTDNSTAATHDLPGGKRGFNDEYVQLVEHFGMKARTIAIGKKEQNGDVESAHGPLKRRIEQQLLLRGNRDFENVEQYERWLTSVFDRANRGRRERFEEELATMAALHVARLPEFVDKRVGVTSWSTIRVERCTYSVPSRLIGEQLRVRVYEGHLDVFHGNCLQLKVERLRGREQHRIDYRHVIWSLVQKPGAFARYRYREDLFPTVTFRTTYDAICKDSPSRESDLEYLRVLHLAAATIEEDVETALAAMLSADEPITCDAVRARLAIEAEVAVPALAPYEPSLEGYDQLLEEVAP